MLEKNTFDNTQRSLQDSQHLPETETNGNFCCKAPRFRPQPVGVNTVILRIQHLNETKSFGSVNISLRFFKDSMFIIAFYLTVIINTSISTGRFSTSLKHATVTPLFKSGGKCNSSNYCPISLLPIFLKIPEKNIVFQLTTFLESKNYLIVNQYGFRSKLSTKTALTVIPDEIYDIYMDKMQIYIWIKSKYLF